VHGVREYGKDFTFSELSLFSPLHHYGLQTKAEDISGEVNSAIDDIIGQAKDALLRHITNSDRESHATFQRL
jgi:hypothetical protein